VLQFPTRAFDWVTCLGQMQPRDYGKHEFTIPIECSITLQNVQNVCSILCARIPETMQKTSIVMYVMCQSLEVRPLISAACTDNSTYLLCLKTPLQRLLNESFSNNNTMKLIHLDTFTHPYLK